MSTYNIIFNDKAVTKKTLTEAGQTLRVEFTWLQKLDKFTYESQTPWMLCRDYFNEIWHRCWTNGKVKLKKVYGFEIDNLDVRGEDTQYFYLGISYAKVNNPSVDNFSQWLQTFNKIEEMNGFDPTVLKGHNETEQYVIVQCSRQWLDNPTLLNILTLSLRMMWHKPQTDDALTKHPFENVKSFHSSDHSLIYISLKNYSGNHHEQICNSLFYNFEMFANMKNKHCELTNDQLLMSDPDWDPYILHNSSGIVGMVLSAVYQQKSSEFRKKLESQINKTNMKVAA